jgi:hypothetical protein
MELRFLLVSVKDLPGVWKSQFRSLLVQNILVHERQIYKNSYMTALGTSVGCIQSSDMSWPLDFI